MNNLAYMWIRILTTIVLLFLGILGPIYLFYAVGVFGILYINWYTEGFLILLVHFLMHHIVDSFMSIGILAILVLLYIMRNTLFKKFLNI